MGLGIKSKPMHLKLNHIRLCYDKSLEVKRNKKVEHGSLYSIHTVAPFNDSEIFS